MDQADSSRRITGAKWVMKIVRVPKGSRRQVRTLQPKLPSAQDVLVLAALSGKTGHIFGSTQRVTDPDSHRCSCELARRIEVAVALHATFGLMFVATRLSYI